MKFTQQLMAEHRVIENMLDIFENKLVEAQAAKNLDMKFFREFFRFVNEYVISYHCVREEKCLFTPLARRKNLFDERLLEVIEYEHQLGKRKIKELQKTVFKYSINQAALDDVLNKCIEYLEMLRQHIYKEDRLVFPLSDRIMAEEDQAQAFECSKRVEEMLSSTFTGV